MEEEFDMAARIRTVKPDLFRHEGLFELETETGLPVRLAFIGLFCCSDREGRFKWRPRELTLDIMPYEGSTRLSRVLDALGTRGFIRKYRQGSEWYGFIPTFLRHQQINNREQESLLPSISEADEIFAFEPLETINKSSEVNELSTRQPRVEHASSTRHEGKGREGKGREEDQELLRKFDFESAFAAFWKLYPKKKAKPAAELKFKKHCKSDEDFKKIMESLAQYRTSHDWLKNGGQYIPYPAAWLNQEQFNDEVITYDQQANGQGSGTGRLSLVDQVRQRGREIEAERSRQTRPGAPEDAELPPAWLAEGGTDWDGEFSRVNEADGSLMGADD